MDFNILNEKTVMPFFKQEIMEHANKRGDLTSKEYLAANQHLEKLKNFIDQLFLSANLDALCGPATGTPWCNDVINGDHWTGYGAYTPAAIVGYPSITVPMGFLDGLPLGMAFIGQAFNESLLIALGYSYEQVSKNRKAPEFIETLKI